MVKSLSRVKLPLCLPRLDSFLSSFQVFYGAGEQSRTTFQVQIHPPLTFPAYFAQCICPKRCARFLVRKRKKPAPEQSQRPFRSRFSLILQYFGLFQPQKQENCLIYLVDKSGNLFGISTVHGYNAPCFDSMVHYFMGSVLMRRDNEDGKDNIKSAYRTV